MTQNQITKILQLYDCNNNSKMTTYYLEWMSKQIAAINFDFTILKVLMFMFSKM